MFVSFFQKMSKKRGVYFFERYESPGFEELLKRARVCDVVVVATMTVCFSINVRVFCETQTCFVTNTKSFMETETSVTEQTKIVIDLSLGVQTSKRENGTSFHNLKLLKTLTFFSRCIFKFEEKC